YREAARASGRLSGGRPSGHPEVLQSVASPDGAGPRPFAYAAISRTPRHGGERLGRRDVADVPRARLRGLSRQANTRTTTETTRPRHSAADSATPKIGARDS